MQGWSTLPALHFIHLHVAFLHIAVHISIKLIRILFVIFAADFFQKVLLEHPQGIFAEAAGFTMAGILCDFFGKRLWCE